MGENPVVAKEQTITVTNENAALVSVKLLEAINNNLIELRKMLEQVYITNEKMYTLTVKDLVK